MNFLTASRFPLDVQNALPLRKEWSTRDSILQSTSIAYSLLEFHANASAEANTPEDEESDDLFTTKFPPLNIHEHSDPYFISRAYVDIVKETRLLDKKVYMKQQEKLRQEVDTCVHIAAVQGTIQKWECHRSFMNNGPFETLVGFDVDAPSGPPRVEYAYGPFLDVNPNAVGPRDIKRLPFDRKTCLPPSTATAEGKLGGLLGPQHS